MSFNKRFYNWESIVNSAGTESFEIFDRGIIKPDAHISDSELTGDFLKAYLDSDIETRKILQGLLLEREIFIKDFLKLHFMLKDDRNQEKHDPSVTKYIDLFFTKWEDLATKYRNIL